MTSLTTFLLGNFFFNLKQLSKFEWVFLFLFSHKFDIWQKNAKKKAKWREKIRNKWTRPSKQKKLCWRNESREKKTFRLIPKLLFFSLWPMTTSDQWQQVFLFETSSICLPEWLCWKKKKQFTDQMQAKSSENSTKKETTLLPSIEKKNTWAFLF